MDRETLRKAVVESLVGSLSFDGNIRATAEDQLKLYETSEDFGIVLVELIIDQNAPPEVRQLASVLLKQYVECHWSSTNEEKFKAPETTAQAKSTIRQTLPQGLQDENRKIRIGVAYTISHIAQYDWPHEWPDLFELLIRALNSGNNNIIHGAMRVFAEFAEDISDLQIPHIAPVLFPEMMKIFSHPEIYGPRTCSRAAGIFKTMSGMIGLMKEFMKGVDKQHLFPFLPDFIAACVMHLQAPAGPTSDIGLKTEVLKALEVLVKEFPKAMVPHITTILPPVWLIFTQSVDVYLQTTVNCAGDEQENAVDEDGEVLSFENLVFSVFEFISALIESPKFKKTVEQYLEEILFFTMVYMQITDEQVDLWSNDPNQFVEDEDEETLSFSVRISAQYLILSLSEKFSTTSLDKICNALGRVRQSGEQAKAAGTAQWWKYYEVCLLCLGYVQPVICDQLESGEMKSQFKDFIISTINQSQMEAVSPYMVGQSFWCGSRYSPVLPDEVIARTLQLTVAGVQGDQNTVLRCYSVKSLFGFCNFLKDSDKVSMLHPHLEAIMTGLLSMASTFTDSVLAITLETICIVIKVNPEFTSTLATKSNLVPLINALFIKYAADHHLSPLLEEMVGELAAIEPCYRVVLEKIVPTLLSILESPEEKTSPVFITPTINMLENIVRKGTKPLHELFVKRGLPLVIHKTMNSDDSAVVQQGGECLRAFVSSSPEQVLTWQDGSGQSGLAYIIQVICKLLDPRAPENNATFVGKLINVLVIKAGNQLGENLDLLLRCVLSKLQQVQVFTVSQSLLMVFIQLIRHQLGPTLEFLSTVPGPTGNSALEYVLTRWCDEQTSFFGGYETKASCDGLCKLLQHAIATGDTRFQEIMVNGDEITTNGISTRSKTKKAAPQYTKIPMAVKFFKLLVGELQIQLESAEREGDDDEDDDDEDDEDCWEDEELEESKGNIQDILESMFAPSGNFAGFDDDGEEDDDPDVADDPINKADSKVWLSEFVNEFSKQPFFGSFAEMLNGNEKQCLTKVLSPS